MRSSLAALLILACTLASCGGGGNDSPPTPELAANRASAVITAGGTATRARISYAVDTAAPTEVNVTLPWTLTQPLTRGQTLTANATNLDAQGNVSLQITSSEGGVVTSSGTSTATVRFSCCN
jgi:hypothetical protein